MSMIGTGPKFPLMSDEIDGHYVLNKTTKETVKQNLKFLFLTSPGERIHNTNFGIGLRRSLFEQNTTSLHRSIDSRIRTQISIYLPYVSILSVEFISSLTNSDIDENSMGIKLVYKINTINVSDGIVFSVGTVAIPPGQIVGSQGMPGLAAVAGSVVTDSPSMNPGELAGIDGSIGGSGYGTSNYRVSNALGPVSSIFNVP